MNMKTEMLKIIEGGLNKNPEKVKNYALLIVEKLSQEGEEAFASKIRSLISNSSAHPVYLDEFLSKPMDNDSRLNLVDVEMEIKNTDPIILPNVTKVKIDNFIESIRNRDKFIKMGVDLPESVLLYGAPGCGKTSVAQYIAKEIGLPLVVAKFDALVSSLLGNTAKNISRIFSYANEKPCILFLDEFDAIAKARDDKYEVGELKRVVNSLLQNIDQFNNNNILIAATNHENMLDPAVWRRFSNVIEIPKPTEYEIERLLDIYLKEFKYDFKDDSKLIKTIIKVLNGLSPSDIKTICYSSIKNAIINKEDILTYSRFVYNIYLYYNISTRESDVIKFLVENSVKQKDIGKLLNISLRQVRKVLSEKED